MPTDLSDNVTKLFVLRTGTVIFSYQMTRFHD